MNTSSICFCHIIKCNIFSTIYNICCHNIYRIKRCYNFKIIIFFNLFVFSCICYNNSSHYAKYHNSYYDIFYIFFQISFPPICTYIMIPFFAFIFKLFQNLFYFFQILYHSIISILKTFI